MKPPHTLWTALDLDLNFEEDPHSLIVSTMGVRRGPRTGFTWYLRLCRRCDHLFKSENKGRHRQVCPGCRVRRPKNI